MTDRTRNSLQELRNEAQEHRFKAVMGLLVNQEAAKAVSNGTKQQSHRNDLVPQLNDAFQTTPNPSLLSGPHGTHKGSTSSSTERAPRENVKDPSTPTSVDPESVVPPKRARSNDGSVNTATEEHSLKRVKLKKDGEPNSLPKGDHLASSKPKPARKIRPRPSSQAAGNSEPGKVVSTHILKFPHRMLRKPNEYKSNEEKLATLEIIYFYEVPVDVPLGTDWCYGYYVAQCLDSNLFFRKSWQPVTYWKCPTKDEVLELIQSNFPMHGKSLAFSRGFIDGWFVRAKYYLEPSGQHRILKRQNELQVKFWYDFLAKPWNRDCIPCLNIRREGLVMHTVEERDTKKCNFCWGLLKQLPEHCLLSLGISFRDPGSDGDAVVRYWRMRAFPLGDP